MANSQDSCINDNKNNENTSPVEYSDDFFEKMDAEIMAYSQDFCIMDNNNENALPAENMDDIDMDLDQIIDFGTASETLLSFYDGILKTSFESLLSDGVFESTLDLQEFAASLLTGSDSHDSVDPIMFSDSEPVKDGDLVLQNRGGLNDDHLHSSDVFNELTPIVTL
ncbi:unnamed protein product [Arabis nemorensis]|nr:unnamed protein product [Arabis nemorensis]